MSQFQKYLARAKSLHAIWVDESNEVNPQLRYSVSQDNGQNWNPYISIGQVKTPYNIDFEIDELGTTFVVVESSEGRVLYSKKQREEQFVLSFLDQEQMA